MKSTHINLVLAAEVAAGRESSTKVVGTAIDSFGTWYNVFVAFNRDGSPSVSEKTGSQKFNFRKQG